MGRQKWRETLADKSELKKIWGGVFDSRTIMCLSKLLQTGKISTVDSIIKEGKESKVVAGHGPAGPVAIKIYAVEAANFRRMQPYLQGDPRFQGLRADRGSIVKAWATKEFKNLLRAREAGVNCPEPMVVRGNVLVTGFIGDWPLPAARMIDSAVENPQKIFEQLIEQVRLLWIKAGIVHGDLSAYNILIWKDKPWLIDFSQSVLREHPQADEFLRRDIHNLVSWAKKYDVEADENEVLVDVKKPF